MGLFDFLKRKSAPAPEDDGPSPDYVFAHYALRQVALSDPLRFLAAVASPDARALIDAILRDVERECGRQATFDAEGIKIHPTRTRGGYPCAVIEFPEPRQTADAFMVALVALVDSSSPEPVDGGPIRARFFTLEKGTSLSGEARTVLAEWDERGHSNYGDGPDPTPDAFVAALDGHL